MQVATLMFGTAGFAVRRRSTRVPLLIWTAGGCLATAVARRSTYVLTGVATAGGRCRRHRFVLTRVSTAGGCLFVMEFRASERGRLWAVPCVVGMRGRALLLVLAAPRLTRRCVAGHDVLATNLVGRLTSKTRCERVCKPLTPSHTDPRSCLDGTELLQQSVAFREASGSPMLAWPPRLYGKLVVVAASLSVSFLARRTHSTTLLHRA
jgi:hypothetical protein